MQLPAFSLVGGVEASFANKISKKTKLSFADKFEY